MLNRILLAGVCSLLVVLLAPPVNAAPSPSRNQGVTDQQIAAARKEANDCMSKPPPDGLGIRPFDVSKKKPQGDAYRRWVLRLWKERAATCKTILHSARNNIQTASVIAFGPNYVTQALTVAKCESGWAVHAGNGQYQGAWQMGSSERATYGHGYDFLSQAKAASRYFVASGRDWSPWQCSPHGGLQW